MSGEHVPVVGPTDEIVGRESEMASLAAFLERVPTGPVAMVIEGEAGIGKTTVLKGGVAGARDRRYRILACSPVEAETKYSFAAVGDMLEDAVNEALPHLPDPQRRALEIALLRSDSRGGGPDQRTVSVAVLGVIRLLAGRGPVLIAADDIQWLDTPSTHVMEFALRRLATEPVGVLVSVRAERGEPVPLGLDRALPPDRLTRVRVGPMSLGALHHLIGSRLERPLPRPTLLRIREATGGNPFFALEMARAMEGALAPGPGQALPVPDSLRELVQLRLAKLPARTRKSLLAVSALSRPTTTLLEQAAGARGAVSADLEKASGRGVIEIEGGDIRFAHPLLGSVIYAEASDRERRSLHRRLAAVVSDPEERARHLALGTDAPDAGVAATLDEAARAARFRGAPDAAAELLEMAGRLTPPGRKEEAWRRTTDAARYHHASGVSLRARTLLEEVIGSASGTPRARALLELASVLHDAEGPARCVPLLERALGEARDEVALRTDIERDLAHNLLMMGHLPDAGLHARAAVELASTLNEIPTLAATRIGELLIRARADGIPPALLEEARALTDSAASRAEETGDHISLESARQMLALLLTDVGRLDEARGIYLDEYRRVTERGDDFLRHYLSWCLARLEHRAGDFALAARYAEESHAASLGQEGLLCEGLYSRAETAAVLGQVDTARRSAEEGLAIAERLGFALSAVRNMSVLGFLELSLGNITEAHHRLAPAVDAMHEMGLGEPAYIPCVPDEIEALIGMGALDEAASLIELLEERGRALDRAWALAAGARCRGLLQAAGGDLPRSLTSLGQAIREHGRVAQPFELARSLLVRGQVERRMRKWGAARASLDLALEAFERLPAPLWADKARAELRRIGGRPPSRGGLTPTEEKVAELAAAGLSNREIAEALFMSVNTVEANLSRIYHKLGVRSRAELGARIAAGDLTGN